MKPWVAFGIGMAGGGTGYAMNSFAWQGDHAGPGWLELRLLKKRYWLSIPEGHLADPSLRPHPVLKDPVRSRPTPRAPGFPGEGKVIEWIQVRKGK